MVSKSQQNKDLSTELSTIGKEGPSVLLFQEQRAKGACLEMAHRGRCRLDHVELCCPAMELVCYSKCDRKSLDHLVEV